MSWSTNDGHIVSGSSTISPVVDQAGLYQIVATDNVNGCTNTAEVEVLQELNVPSDWIMHSCCLCVMAPQDS
ncbi:MAG: hypothetical protein R2778_07790 [Saprospiraceae bacterium]